MSDYSELKNLADSAILGGFEEGMAFRSKCRPSVIGRLIEENESLRRDAERYRWLNSDASRDSGMIPEFDGEKWSVIYLDSGAGGSGGGVCEAVFYSANEAVDFAMSKGARP